VKPPDLEQKEFDDVEITAAEWFSRKEFGLTPQQSEELIQWLNADSYHARVFTQLEQTSRALDRWSETLPTLSDLPLYSPRVGRTVKFHRWSCAAALAALIAIIAFVTYRTCPPRSLPYTLTAATAVGGLRTLSLPDGSLIRLNTDSTVDIRYLKEERRVRLTRGEALFEVAKNPVRPFFVEAGKVSVRAVGTVFNVRLQTNSVDVLVTEGRVRVEDSAKGGSLLPIVSGSAEPPVLEAGHEAIFDVRPEVATLRLASVVAVPTREIERTLAWQEKRLAFGSVPLSEVVAEFNRYNTHKLVIDDPGLASQQFGGTFRADGYETLLSLLEQNFDVVLDHHNNETILRRRGH
jgi:transmembrane sensor